MVSGIRFLGPALFAATALSAVTPQAAAAQPIDAEVLNQALGVKGTADLDDIIARANNVAELAARCKALDCPELQTCDQVKQLDRDMAELLDLLLAQRAYLELAQKAQLASFVILMQGSRTTGDQQANLINAIALQDSLIRFSDSLTQVATLIGSARALLSGDSSRADKLLSAVKVLVTIPSLIDTLDTSEPLADGFSSGDIGNISGSLAGAAVKLESAQKELQKVLDGVRAAAGPVAGLATSPSAGATATAALTGFQSSENLVAGAARADSILADVGELVQGLLSSYAKGQLSERQQRLADLMRQASSEDATIAGAFINQQQSQRRRLATIDAIAALEQALSELAGCMNKAKCRQATRPRTALPVSPAPPPRTDGLPQGGWARPLTLLLPEVERLRPKVTSFSFVNNCPPDGLDDIASPAAATPFTYNPAGSIPPQTFLLPWTAESTTFCTSGSGNPVPIPVVTVSPAGSVAASKPDPCERRTALESELEALRKRANLFDQARAMGAPIDEPARRANLARIAALEAELAKAQPCPDPTKPSVSPLPNANGSAPMAPPHPLEADPEDPPRPAPPCDKLRQIESELATQRQRLQRFRQAEQAGAPIDTAAKALTEETIKALESDLRREQAKAPPQCPAPQPDPCRDLTGAAGKDAISRWRFVVTSEFDGLRVSSLNRNNNTGTLTNLTDLDDRGAREGTLPAAVPPNPPSEAPPQPPAEPAAGLCPTSELAAVRPFFAIIDAWKKADDAQFGVDPVIGPDTVIIIEAQATALTPQGAGAATAIAGQAIKVFAPSQTVQANALPGPRVAKPQEDHDQPPIQGVTGANGAASLKATAGDLGLSTSGTAGPDAANDRIVITGSPIRGGSQYVSPSSTRTLETTVETDITDSDRSLITGTPIRGRNSETSAPAAVVDSEDLPLSGLVPVSERPPLRLWFNLDASKELDSGVTLGGRIRLQTDATPQVSVNVMNGLSAAEIYATTMSTKFGSGALAPFVASEFTIGSTGFATLVFPKDDADLVKGIIAKLLPDAIVEPNLCRTKQAGMAGARDCQTGLAPAMASSEAVMPHSAYGELPAARLVITQQAQTNASGATR